MILVNNPGAWAHLYGPLAHAPWHGWTLTDLVFPFFLFAVGNALAMAPDAAVGRLADPFFWRRWLRRALVIFGLGLLLNAWPFLGYDGSGALQFKELESLRFMGVLQRIALCWACARSTSLQARSNTSQIALRCEAAMHICANARLVGFEVSFESCALESVFL